MAGDAVSKRLASSGAKKEISADAANGDLQKALDDGRTIVGEEGNQAASEIIGTERQSSIVDKVISGISDAMDGLSQVAKPDRLAKWLRFPSKVVGPTQTVLTPDPFEAYGAAIGGGLGLAGGVLLGARAGPIGSAVLGVAGGYAGSQFGGFVGRSLGDMIDPQRNRGEVY